MNTLLHTLCSRRAQAALLLLGILLMGWPLLGLAQEAPTRQARPVEDGVLIRVNGDAALEAGDTEAVVIVVQGDARVAGTAEVVVVVDGTATLTGARVTELIVVQGEAVLEAGTVVAGDVQLVNAGLTRAEDAVVQGEVRYGSGGRIGRGLLVFGLIFGLGTVMAVLLSGLVAAAVAPQAMRAAGAVLTDEFGPTLLATLVVWVGFPLVAMLAFVTVVGIPAALGIVVFLLPALAFLGYLVSGIRLGDYILGRARGRDEAWHPYAAAVIGLAVLLGAGWIPLVGSVVTPVAAWLGAGAIALRAWRAARRPRSQQAALSMA